MIPRRFALLLAAVAVACQTEGVAPPSAPAAAPRWAPAARPDSVVVIVNSRSPESRETVAYYVSRRSIPEENVCPIDTAPVEAIERSTYVSEIEAPVAACLVNRELAERALYLVTTLGVPLKIRGSTGDRGTAASVDSELTLLYGEIHGATFAAEGSSVNPFFGRRETPFGHPRFPIYLVTRLAAHSVESVFGMIDRSLAARNRGRVVLDLSSPEDKPGNSWLRTAALLIPEDRVVIDETARVLHDLPEVIGYASWGSNDKRRRRRLTGFEWLPGAIATEFVSTNARTFSRPPETWTLGSWDDKSTWFGGAPQSLAADYIEEGASGVAGHVYEPYLANTPRPEHLFAAYLSGRNLAESFYLSIPVLGWMHVVIGDPLCTLGE